VLLRNGPRAGQGAGFVGSSAAENTLNPPHASRSRPRSPAILPLSQRRSEFDRADLRHGHRVNEAPVKKTPEQRDADFIRRLASGFDGEIVATVHTWRRKLSSVGRDLHDVANIVEGGGKLTEAEMRKLYDAGYEAGLQEGESRHPVTTCSVEIFDLYDMAQWVWKRCDRLQRRHRDFVEGMVELTSAGVELSPKQRTYLKSLYRQLGGR
jgi:hypothetical protein